MNTLLFASIQIIIAANIHTHINMHKHNLNTNRIKLLKEKNCSKWVTVNKWMNEWQTNNCLTPETFNQLENVIKLRGRQATYNKLQAVSLELPIVY